MSGRHTALHRLHVFRPYSLDMSQSIPSATRRSLRNSNCVPAETGRVWAIALQEREPVSGSRTVPAQDGPGLRMAESVVSSRSFSLLQLRLSASRVATSSDL